MIRDDRGIDPELLAIDALGFLAEDVERLGRFLALTGIAPETLREAARAPGFFAAVLDHLAQDEALLLAFAANRQVAPERVLAARDRLAGHGAEI
ncbi:DUF3572 domain-containing protein [Rhabdaerophilum calidifontis]|uniref:DUF3572 domain-containing protein n=1 Tax=Rhabdaerophilum calidifontis TaxID=2604328 RepID=UPI001238CDBA|nr:DUF3572 domain-containing protein [Rhabdaerophilum calidifontis]